MPICFSSRRPREIVLLFVGTLQKILVSCRKGIVFEGFQLNEIENAGRRCADDAPALASDAPDSLVAGVRFTRVVDCQGTGILFSRGSARERNLIFRLRTCSRFRAMFLNNEGAWGPFQFFREAAEQTRRWNAG